MPNIELVPVPTYQPLQPYHHIFDNLPIDGLVARVSLVNNQVDLNTANLLQSIGTQGTLANRLAQSINPDGSIKTVAVDNALHSIAQHLDGGGFVRMTLVERAKLSFISPNATSLAMNVETISGTLAFVDTTLEIEPSDSIVWRYSGGKLAAETNFPASVRHSHFYGVVPWTADYQNYLTTGVATPYTAGTLRVYVNGVRLNTYSGVYVPLGFPGVITWTTLFYTEGAVVGGVVTGGDFVLSAAPSASENVVIDFDVLYS